MPTSQGIAEGAMDDATSWRELGERFRTLQPHDQDGLRGEWYSIDRRWLLGGAPSDSVLRRFKSAATRAAVMLGFPSVDALDAWLDRLKAEEDVFTRKSDIVFKDLGVNGKLTSGVDVTIPRVCEVSADYCEKLADRASEPEETKTTSGSPAAAQNRLQRTTITTETKRQRRQFVREYRRHGDLTLAVFARHCGMSGSAISGIINEDRRRYSLETQARFLKKIGVSREDWYRK